MEHGCRLASPSCLRSPAQLFGCHSRGSQNTASLETTLLASILIIDMRHAIRACNSPLAQFSLSKAPAPHQITGGRSDCAARAIALLGAVLRLLRLGRCPCACVCSSRPLGDGRLPTRG